LIKQKKALYDLELDSKATFADYPLSAQTLRGIRRYLPESENASPTAIQRATLLTALRGKDILAAAKTGSGKTLAFLIPLLEKLWTERWTNQDSTAAVVLSPTRELAMQTYDVLRTIAIRHDFSASLIIGGQTGGKNFKEEAGAIGRMNIIIATPGRLCQHLTETAGFNLDSTLLFVLDEADRMLDMGFKTQIDRIISYLPKNRQTLLFSATQTTKISDLARLSLNDPVYVNTSSNSRLATPALLKQTYCIVKPHEKLNFLFSFIKNVAIKQKTKTLVFMATCKQVMHAKEVLFKMKPGLPMMRLHSKMGQHQRMATYDEFCRKERALLIATDLCARGMDFPGVDWVVQLDCPESPDEYIHRAGRTARNNSSGNSVLCVTQGEKDEMLVKLKSKKVELTSWKVNKDRMTDLTPKLRAFTAESEEIKGYATRAFQAYCKSIHLSKDKKIFQIQNYKLDKYAASLGLAVTPRLRFLERDPNLRKGLGKAAAASVKLEEDSSDEDIFDVKLDQTEITKLDELEIEADLEKKHSKPEKAKKLITKAIRNQEKKSVKIASDDEEAAEDGEDEDEDFDISKAKDRLALADVDDRAKEKQTKKEKRLEKKMKEKERKRAILEGKMKNVEDEDEEGGEDEEVDFNPETKSFLDALTLPDGASDSDDDRDSFSEEPVVKKKRGESEDDFEDSEDEMMDTEQLEKFALAQL